MNEIDRKAVILWWNDTRKAHGTVIKHYAVRVFPLFPSVDLYQVVGEPEGRVVHTFSEERRAEAFADKLNEMRDNEEQD